MTLQQRAIAVIGRLPEELEGLGYYTRRNKDMENLRSGSQVYAEVLRNLFQISSTSSINASREVYDIFETTGFTELLDV